MPNETETETEKVKAQLDALIQTLEYQGAAISARDKAAFEIELRKIAFDEHRQSVHEADIAGFWDRLRAQHWHDLMLEVYKGCLSSLGRQARLTDLQRFAELAKAGADMVYPPQPVAAKI